MRCKPFESTLNADFLIDFLPNHPWCQQEGVSDPGHPVGGTENWSGRAKAGEKWTRLKSSYNPY